VIYSNEADLPLLSSGERENVETMSFVNEVQGPIINAAKYKP
jgi:hypothetical protein